MAAYNRMVALAAASAVLGLAGVRNSPGVEEVKPSCPSGKNYLDMSHAEYTACLAEEGVENLKRRAQEVEHLEEDGAGTEHNRFGDIGPAVGGPIDSFQPSAPVEFEELSRRHYEKTKTWAQEIADNLNRNVLEKTANK